MHDTKLSLCDDELEGISHLPQATLHDHTKVNGHDDEKMGVPETKEERPLTEPAPTLSAEQNQILARILAGESMFFTGSAGKLLGSSLPEISTCIFDRNGEICSSTCYH